MLSKVGLKKKLSELGIKVVEGNYVRRKDIEKFFDVIGSKVGSVDDLDIILREDLCSTYQVLGPDKDGGYEPLEVDFTSKEDAVKWAKDWINKGRKKEPGMSGWTSKK